MSVTSGAPATSGWRADFLLRHLAPALGCVALLLALESTDLDHTVGNWFFNSAAGRFPLRYNPALEIVMHQWAKYVVVLIACSAIAGFLFSFAAERWRPWRRLLLFLSLSLALAPGAVSVLKHVSNKHCPYDLVEYGGVVPYRGLLDDPPPGVEPGHCFPSGHASAGFALLAFYFAGLALGRPRFAHAGLWIGLGAGAVFGFTRMVQGAHFLSHNLWAALVCWLVMLAIYAAVLAPPQDAFKDSPAGLPRRPRSTGERG